MSAALPTGSTISYSGIIAAGATLPVSLHGTMFYLTVATLPLFIRPTGQSPWSQFQPGTGTETPSQFNILEIYNGNTVPVTFEVVAGFAPFIDHRLLPNLQAPNVVVTAVWTGSGQAWDTILLDKSGTQITDLNGNSWIAVQRVSLSMQETTLAIPPDYPSLVLSGAAGQDGGQLMQVVSSTDGINPPTVLVVSGNFTIHASIPLPGGPNVLGATVSVLEIYSALAPGFGGIPPS
jgi:hypothetical protein